MLDGSPNMGTTFVEKVSIAGAQVGAASSIFGFMSLNQWLAVGGFALAVLSFIFQICSTIYFKSKHLRLAEARFRADLDEKTDSNDDS